MVLKRVCPTFGDNRIKAPKVKNKIELTVSGTPGKIVVDCRKTSVNFSGGNSRKKCYFFPTDFLQFCSAHLGTEKL